MDFEINENESLDQVQVNDIDAVFDELINKYKTPQLIKALNEIKSLPDDEREKWLLNENEEVATRTASAVAGCAMVIFVIAVVTYYVWVTIEVKDPVTGVIKKIKEKQERQKKVKQKKVVEVEANEDGTCPAPEED